MSKLSRATAERGAAIQRWDRERAWMDEHGGTRAGYVARYGSKDDPEHYGDGGEAIFAADLAKVEKYEAEALEAVRVAREAREAQR